MKLMILDGNSVINRAFYGIRPLTTRDGLYTNAIFGFLNILERVRSEEAPDALCVAFDLHGPTFRHLRYDGYKATRHPMPEELAQQMPVMKEVLRAMNIPIYECQGWEADDVIGTVATRCAESGWQCVILTGDRDSLQLVSDRVTVKLVRTQGGQTLSENYTPERFFEEYGMEPLRLIDLKALMGDSSDNIPGVAGVGPKTATDLLHRFGTLDGVYANLTPQNMKGKLFEKLQNGREAAYLSYELATIRCNAPIGEFTPERNLCQPPKQQELYELFLRLEFHRLIDRYGLRAAPKEEPEAMQVSAGKPLPSLGALVALLEAKYIALSADLRQGVVALRVQGEDYLLQRATLGTDFERALALLFSPDVPKVAHDCKPLLRALAEQDIEAGGFIFDTALAAYLLDPTDGDYSLPRVVSDTLRRTLVTAEPTAEAQCVAALYEAQLPLLREQGSERLYFDVELPLCAVLSRMEQAGMAVERSALDEFGKMLAARIADCEQMVYAAAGEEFNINSPRQLGEVLFEKMAIPAVKKTKSGYSTNAEVLEKLVGQYPVVQSVLDYRMLSKLKSTYADGLLKQIAADGRIHTTFQNTVTATGRLSSTEPNLQNIPVRTELGSEIRKMFVPREGCVFVDADYGQIELRVLAHLADDETMIDAFRSGEDIHTATAAQVFGLAPEAVTPLMRRHAKAVNFGIVYGISEFSLAQDIGVSRSEAKAYIDSYLERYAGVRRFMHDAVEFVREHGYAQTMFGRRRAIPEIRSSNFNIRSAAERIALNTPVQGTAADIIKIAMLRVDAALRAEVPEARLLLQVHDELIVECPAQQAQKVSQIVAREMENAVALRVPLIAEAKCGESWFAAK